MRISDWISDVCSSDLATAPVLERTGWWMSDRLDGGRDGQIWRTGLLRLSALPPGTQVRLEALTSDNPDALPETQNLDILKDLFRVSLEHREPAQRPPGDDDPTRLDFHVAAPPGRYIWLRLSSEEHPSELQSLTSISYAVFCLK